MSLRLNVMNPACPSLNLLPNVPNLMLPGPEMLLLPGPKMFLEINLTRKKSRTQRRETRMSTLVVLSMSLQRHQHLQI